MCDYVWILFYSCRNLNKLGINYQSYIASALGYVLQYS